MGRCAVIAPLPGSHRKATPHPACGHLLSREKALRVDIQLHRAMVAPHHIHQNLCFLDLIGQAAADEEIVDPPACVPLTGADKI